MDRKQPEASKIVEGKLRKAIVDLSNKFGSKDLCILRFILYDGKQIPIGNAALQCFTNLLELEKITINNVSMVYEILHLMKKNKWWTKFRKRLTDDRVNVPDYNYFDKGDLTHFSDFRLTMINVGQQLTDKDVGSLKMMYDVPEDVGGIWMTLLHLEEKDKVNMSETSMQEFLSRLNIVNNVQAESIINQYAETAFKTKSTHQATRQSLSDVGRNEEKSRGKKNDNKRLSLQHDIIIEDVNRRKRRVAEMMEKVKTTAEGCIENIEQTGKQLKDKVDLMVSTQIEDLEIMKQNKLVKLEQDAQELEEFSLKIEELRKHPTKLDSLILEEIEEIYPESVGYFTCQIKNISNELDKFEDMVNRYCRYVDYKLVDAGKCSIDFPEVNNRCVDINKSLNITVHLKDSDGNDVREVHENAPVTVNVELLDPEKPDHYKLFRKSKSKNIHTLQFKFNQTGLWRMCVYVCGEQVSEPIDFTVISNDDLKKTISLKTKEFVCPIFDVCFTSHGKRLLACNNTSKIFVFDLHYFRPSGPKSWSIGVNKKFANLCCIDDGDIFLTESTEREIVVLDRKGQESGRFGKGDFEGGIPQGIAVTCNSNDVHVFVSNNEGKCIQHYKNQRHYQTITNLPDMRSISPWFLDVNTELQLFICNNKATKSSSDQDNANPSNVCFVEILNVKSKELVKSIKCDSAVCIDEKYNVFLGMNFGIKMFDKDLRFVKEVACSGDCSYGLSAFAGRLAVVCPGSIKLYKY